jgi:hypothetical protein
LKVRKNCHCEFLNLKHFVSRALFCLGDLNAAKDYSHLCLNSLEGDGDMRDFLTVLSMLNQLYRALNKPNEAAVYSAKMAQVASTLKARGILPNVPTYNQ